MQAKIRLSKCILADKSAKDRLIYPDDLSLYFFCSQSDEKSNDRLTSSIF